MLRPGKFVCHSHQRPDKGIVHWGFSRDNWPAYIQIWEDYSEEEKQEKEKILNEFKSKYSPSLNSKRKSDENEEEQRKRLRETRETKDMKEPSHQETHAPLTIPNIHPFEKVLHPAAGLGQLVDPRQIFPWALVPHNNYIQSLAHIQLRIMLDQQQLQQQQQLQAQQQQLHHLQQLPQHQQFGLHQQLTNTRWPPIFAGNESRRLPENMSPPVSQGKDTSLEISSEHPGLPLLGGLPRGHVFAARPREQSPVLGRPRSDQSPALGISRDQSPAPGRQRGGGDQSPVPSAARYLDHSPLSMMRPRDQSSSGGGSKSRDLSGTPTSSAGDEISRHQQDIKPPVFDEAMVGVAAVLAASGLGEKSKLEVLSVVERLVERLKSAEMEKVNAALHLKGMEERICSLEAELQRNKSLTTSPTNNTTNNNKQEDETSSDGGIESGTEVDGDIV
jgi:hypothetical protein